MLLDFPVEPDASTMEIISDSVYANSSVLDGRRFATEFVSRRMADVARARSNGGANSAASGGTSGGSVGATASGRGKGVSVADGTYPYAHVHNFPGFLTWLRAHLCTGRRVDSRQSSAKTSREGVGIQSGQEEGKEDIDQTTS
jgi:hypothetical protein